MAKNRISVAVLCCLMFSIALSGCYGKPPARIEISVEPPLSGGLGWALVVSAYAPARANPDIRALQKESLRRGDIQKIEESRFDAEYGVARAFWYRTDRGWLHSQDVQIFPTEERAQRAARTLRAAQ